MADETYIPRIPDEATMRAYAEGRLDKGDLENLGFGIYEVRMGMFRYDLPMPGWDLNSGRRSTFLDELIERKFGSVSPR